ncbi:hypothetical protein Syn7502_03155 [Synechococcus sp. PCC 7502]|uniref:hypothetical protein n=1 Tax=Synechococcus sp. PCC 7502 TaxID=1173263 RepID=UPI00029F9BC9|nr:hypothetical protein [Synechococcus sp. PCC 7502]AFY75044.1 hypothetical protein Syn7502_03155 [Synechococcus sp. PCC 7502]
MEYKILTLDESIPLWKRIQMIFPDEPDWESLEEEVLVKLVEDFDNEQSCATTAIIYMSTKNPSQCQRLAKWLLEHEDSDQWLKSAAKRAIEYCEEQ